MRRFLIALALIVGVLGQTAYGQLAVRLLLRSRTPTPTVIFLNDTFTGSTGTTLGSHVGEIGATWTTDGGLVLSNENRLRHGQLSGETLGIASGIPPNAVYDVDATFHVKTVIAGHIDGICARVPVTATVGNVTGYCVYYVASSGAWELYRVQNEGYTQLGTYTQALSGATNYAVRLEIRSGSKKVYIDTVERIASTDDAIASTGRVAVYAEGLDSDTTGIHIADITGTEKTDNTGSSGGGGGGDDLGGIRPQMPAAYGMGMTGGCRTGAGGTPDIIHVNSLADTNTLTFTSTIDGVNHYTGTFRGALLSPNGPRCIVFEVSGYISISSDILVTNPYITIAAQTAPAPGVAIRMVADGTPSTSDSAIIFFDTHDVLIQHLRIAPGWYTDTSDSICNSAVHLGGGTSAYNIVLDHGSLRWAQDENFHFGNGTGLNSGITNATVWRSLIAEGLAAANGSSGCTGGGTSGGHGIIGGPARGVAVIQSIIANTRERNPWLGGGSGLVLNNLVYNWASVEGLVFTDGQGGQTFAYSAVGNRMVMGPDTNDPAADECIVRVDDFVGAAGSQLYLSDNTGDNASFPGTAFTAFCTGFPYDPRVGSAPSGASIPAALTPLASTAVETFVKAHAGACPMTRDTADARIISEITSRTGTHYVASQSAVGGYPSLAENKQTYTAPASPFAVASGQTVRTNIEMDLETKARACEP